jgi:hypothetical protein
MNNILASHSIIALSFLLKYFIDIISDSFGKPPLLTVLVEISFSSVGRVVVYNATARGPGIESHQGYCIFWK